MLSSEEFMPQSSSIEEFELEEPKGTKDHPIERRMRPLCLKQNTMIIGIPQEIIYITDLQNGEAFDVYGDVQDQKIIFERKNNKRKQP